MAQDIYLMCKNKIIMSINTDEGRYDILDKLHMPYQLKGKIVDIPKLSNSPTKYEINQMTIAMNKNYQAIIHYLASRVLPLTRENADKLYALLAKDRLDNDYDKAKFAILCRAVSLQDDYWVKNQDDSVTWEDINVRNNSLSETIAQVALHGSSLTIDGKIERSPEFNAQGAYAKAWKRENDGLWLYKLGKDGIGPEAKIEVMVSNLLDKCNVDHVKYLPAISHGCYASKCECITTDQYSILPGTDFISYCNVNNINSRLEMMKIDSEMIYKMCIVDYLVSNRDRHGMNWGFFYDSETMKIVGCHPLFDHNNSFDKEWMDNKDTPYLFQPSVSMRKSAQIAMNNVDFHFTQNITKEDFMNEEQYNSFMDRAKELNIKTKLLDKSKPDKTNDIQKEHDEI